MPTENRDTYKRLRRRRLGLGLVLVVTGVGYLFASHTLTLDKIGAWMDGLKAPETTYMAPKLGSAASGETAPTSSSVAPSPTPPPSVAVPWKASDALEQLAVKGRAPKTGYARSQFGNGWRRDGDCDTRNIILNRDLSGAVVNEKCKVISGTLNDPYTGKTIAFVRGDKTSDQVQIDHVVALSDAWQKGAQGLSDIQRIELANDPLELLAVDGPANQAKSDGDAATWLPSNKPFRCQYISRQISVKRKYNLWVTEAEKQAMKNVLSTCPEELLPVSSLNPSP